MTELLGRKLADASVPLNEAGKKAYRAWGLRLLREGKLTAAILDDLEQSALAEMNVHLAATAGRAMTTPLDVRNRMKRKLEAALGAVDEEEADVVTTESPYQHFGFAKRARLRRHG